MTTYSVALAIRQTGVVVLAIPSLGNLDAYISAVNRMPMLSTEEESNLARRFKEHQDVDAARTLVTSQYFRRVVYPFAQYCFTTALRSRTGRYGIGCPDDACGAVADAGASLPSGFAAAAVYDCRQ